VRQTYTLSSYSPSGLRRMMNRRSSVGVIVVLVVSLGACGRLYGPKSAAVDTAPSPSGAGGKWTLTFADKFATSHSALRQWSTCYDWACTNTGNDELEWYRAQNVSVSGGTLRLTARANGAHGKPYTSGMIQSNHHYVFRYGFAEIRAKVPTGPGLWSAFWLLPSDRSWPPEIDVMEIYGSQPTVAAMTVHYGPNLVAHQSFLGPNFSNGFHTFGVDWEPNSVSWYIDGVLRLHVGVSIAAPMYLLANLAINGVAPPTASTDFPSVMAIEWIRVWQHPGGRRTG